MNIFEQIIQPEITWFKAHERFIIIATLVGAILYGHHEYRTFLDKVDARKADAANVTLQAKVEANATLAQQVQQQASDLKTLVLQVQEQNNQLQLLITARDRAVPVQQKVDVNLPPTELAARIISLAPGGTITPKTDGTYSVDQPETQAIVSQLDLIAPLQADLQDEQTISGNKDVQLDKVNGYVSKLNEQVGGLQQQIIAADAACKANTKVAVDAALKKRSKWYIVAAVLGYLIGAKKL